VLFILFEPRDWRKCEDREVEFQAVAVLLLEREGIGSMDRVSGRKRIRSNGRRQATRHQQHQRRYSDVIQVLKGVSLSVERGRSSRCSAATAPQDDDPQAVSGS
jgi:hypothetical protein